MREFLGGRPMVPFEEPWMDRVDTMKSLHRWSAASITHFARLATFGERLLLSSRLGAWNGIVARLTRRCERRCGATTFSATSTPTGPSLASISPPGPTRLLVDPERAAAQLRRERAMQE